VAVDPSTSRPTPVHDDFRQAVSRFEGGDDSTPSILPNQ
jgi:hypothetical protein